MDLIRGYYAAMPNHILCWVCEGAGQIMVEDWLNPRPCMFCRGVGQLHIDAEPSRMEASLILSEM